jgi:hypothetical protein
MVGNAFFTTKLTKDTKVSSSEFDSRRISYS